MSFPGPGCGFWYADLFFGLVLDCLFSRLAWLSDDVFYSIDCLPVPRMWALFS